MLVEGNLVEWLLLAKYVTLLKYCVKKLNVNWFNAQSAWSSVLLNILFVFVNMYHKSVPNNYIPHLKISSYSKV